MTQKQKIADLYRRMRYDLEQNILPFWKTYLTDTANGGFYGRVKADLTPDPVSPKSVVLNCRLLWTYTKAWEVLADERCKQLAHRAYTYIRDHFWDPLYGGVYWMVTCRGEPGEVEKRTYGQAFLIFSMAEYYRVFHIREARSMAAMTLRLLQEHARFANGGYMDSLTRDWLPDGWVNVWIKNRGGAAKLLNSNMHLFEAILALAQATGEEWVQSALEEQLRFLLEQVMDPVYGHMKAGMDENNVRIDTELNFGHDAECSYLMVEAAVLLGDKALCCKAEAAALELAEALYSEGIDPADSGVCYLKNCQTQALDRTKIWWVEAEAVTAFFAAYQLSGQEKYLDAATSVWRYIEEHIINRDMGDWYAVGIPPLSDPELRAQTEALRNVFDNGEMAGKGKCPYHNSRACFEMMARAGAMLEKQPK